MDFTVKIENSIVDVECQVNRYHDDDLGTLHIRALDLARAAVDILAFAKGWGLTVWLQAFVRPDGELRLLLSQQPELSSLCTAFDFSRLDEIWMTVVREPPLFMALNDLIQGITWPHHAPVNCGRALDGIRNMMTPPDMDRGEGWGILQSNLNVTREYRSFVTSTSAGPRHADRTHIPGDTVTDVTTRSWEIMNRFLEFRKRGNRPLPLDEFPMLGDDPPSPTL